MRAKDTGKWDKNKTIELCLVQWNERNLEGLVKGVNNKVQVLHRAQTLLWSDAGKSDLKITDLLAINTLTLANTRHRWVEKHRLLDLVRLGRLPILDEKQEAFLVPLTCSESLEGRETWSMQLLADRLVELQIVEQAISDETVRRILKKRTQSAVKRAMVYSECRE